ncbi:MAG TPA: hypothetical protein P5136_00310 [Methanofastidiosum sp.]|nr:hypothetical protein [Methanofastidiosum sp.]
MDYKVYIKRKVGNLVNRKNNEMRKAFYTGLTNDKEKEIIVYLRNQQGLDKQQLVDFAKDNFSISDQDAEQLFFMAYPDGLDLAEEKLLCNLNNILIKLDYLPKDFIDKIFKAILEKKDIKIDKIDESVVDSTAVVVGTLLKERHLI